MALGRARLLLFALYVIPEGALAALSVTFKNHWLAVGAVMLALVLIARILLDGPEDRAGGRPGNPGWPAPLEPERQSKALTSRTSQGAAMGGPSQSPRERPLYSTARAGYIHRASALP